MERRDHAKVKKHVLRNIWKQCEELAKNKESVNAQKKQEFYIISKYENKIKDVISLNPKQGRERNKQIN